MPNYLIVLITILVIVCIVAFTYITFVFRRIGIVAKKLDYLVEDLTYKSEKLNPAIDAVVKISTYLDVLESLIKKDAKEIVEFVKNNRSNVEKMKQNINESFGQIELKKEENK